MIKEYECNLPSKVKAIQFILSEYKTLPASVLIMGSNFLVTNRGLYIEDEELNTFTMVAKDEDYIIKDNSGELKFMNREQFESAYALKDKVIPIKKDEDVTCRNCYYSGSIFNQSMYTCKCDLLNKSVLIANGSTCRFFKLSNL